MNKPVVSNLNSSRILLLPFTFDLFAAPGYFACHFFFIPPTSTKVPPAPTPPWTNHFLGSHPNCIPHPDAFNTFKLACSIFAPQHLLSRIDKIWLGNHPDDKFGSMMYHTAIPFQ
jgi:hypothetical protein